MPNMKPIFSSECDLYTSRDYVAAATLLRSRMPGYSVILSRSPVIGSTQLPTAATDGGHVYINPAFFGQLPAVEYRTALLAHEVGHIALRHPMRADAYRRRGTGPNGKPIDLRLYNCAADYVINDDIKHAGLPLGEGWLHDPRFTRDDFVDHVYNTLYAEREAERQQEQEQEQDAAADDASDEADTDTSDAANAPSGEQDDASGEQDDASDDAAGNGGDDAEGDDASADDDAEGDASPADSSQPLDSMDHDGHDDHLIPQYDGTREEQNDARQMDDEDLQRAADDAADLQEQEAEAGDCNAPSESLRSAGRRSAQASNTNWQTELADYMTRSGRGGEQTYRKINKKRFALMGIASPTQQGRLDTLAITIDVSPSVDTAQCDVFLQEMAAAIDMLKPANTLVLLTGRRVETVAEVANGADLLDLERPMAGGTYMASAVKWLEENGYDPDVHLIFTDGEMSDDDYRKCDAAGAQIVLDGEPNVFAARAIQRTGVEPIIARRA